MKNYKASCRKCGESVDMDNLKNHRCKFWKRWIFSPEVTWATAWYLWILGCFTALAYIDNHWTFWIFLLLELTVFLFDESLRKFLEEGENFEVKERQNN